MNLPWPELEPFLVEWGTPLDCAQRGQIEQYLALVAQANAVTNLTAESDPASLLLRHAADGLACVPVLKSLTDAAPARMLDLGAGGGFIGFCVKIAWPQAEVSLMEPLQRKYDVLNQAAVALGLKGLRPLRARAGGPPAAAARYDIIVERALAPLPQAVALAMPLLADKGRFVAFQSEEPDPRDLALAKALLGAHAGFLKCFAYALPREPRRRFLAVFERKA